MRRHNRSKNDNLTFTWGHGPRACSGKTYGQVELRIGTRRAVENYYFTSADKDVPITAGIATRTADRFKTTVKFRTGKGPRRES
jgi:cytochrome P450